MRERGPRSCGCQAVMCFGINVLVPCLFSLPFPQEWSTGCSLRDLQPDPLVSDPQYNSHVVTATLPLCSCLTATTLQMLTDSEGLCFNALWDAIHGEAWSPSLRRILHFLWANSALKPLLVLPRDCLHWLTLLTIFASLDRTNDNSQLVVYNENGWLNLECHWMKIPRGFCWVTQHTHIFPGTSFRFPHPHTAAPDWPL